MNGAKNRSWFSYPIAAISGSAFAVGITGVFGMDPRYAIVSVIGIILLSIAMLLVNRLRDVMVCALFLALPFAGFEKTLLWQSEGANWLAAGIGIGIVDILLAGIYLVWLLEMVNPRSGVRPELSKFDYWLVVFIMAHVLSLFNSSEALFTLFEIVRLIKYALVYFCFAHHIRKFHIKWMLIILFANIGMETAIGLFQHRTGLMVGWGRMKGMDNLAMERELYEVPGFEATVRAEGTLIDSHAYGHFLAILMAFPLALALRRAVGAPYRWISAATLLLGLVGLIASFSRASWLGFISAALLISGMAAWRHGWRSVMVAVPIALLALGPLVAFGPFIYSRVFKAPTDQMVYRGELIDQALEIWFEHPLIGNGANTYSLLQEAHGFSSGGREIYGSEIFWSPPVHNVPLLIASETGVIGLAAYVALMGISLSRAFRLGRSPDPLSAAMGSALAGGMAAHAVHIMFDPASQTNVLYLLFWMLSGVTAALHRGPDGPQDDGRLIGRSALDRDE